MEDWSLAWLHIDRRLELLMEERKKGQKANSE
jgi:hypothetical protein